MRPPRSVLAPVARARESVKRHGSHAGCPDDRPGVDPPARPSDLKGHAPLVDGRRPRALVNRHAKRFEVVGHLLRELLAERGDHSIAGVEQDDPGSGGVDPPEGALHRARGDCELAGDLHAGGTPADDDERQPFGPLGRIVGAFGLLEGAIEAPAQVERRLRGSSARR